MLTVTLGVFTVGLVDIPQAHANKICDDIDFWLKPLCLAIDLMMCEEIDTTNWTCTKYYVDNEPNTR